MNRLMQPRPARTGARGAASAVRTVESGATRLTVVTHPVGASSPILTEPPEAGFIMEAAATFAELQLRHQPPVNPRPLQPFIPASALPMGDALAALETMLAGIRPRLRQARTLDRASLRGYIQSHPAPPAFQLPGAEPVWSPWLGLTFRVAGIDSGSSSVSTAPLSGDAAKAIDSTTPIAHRGTPSRRGARSLIPANEFAIGAHRLLPPPALAAPLWRIALPKPALSPFRPRYAFAPPPPEVTAEPIPEKLAGIRPLSAPERADRKKQRGGKNANLRKASGETPVRNVEPGKQAANTNAPPEKAVVESPAESFSVPSFRAMSDPAPEGFWSRIPGWQKAAAALVILGIAVGAWAVPVVNRRHARTMTLPASAAPAPVNVGADSWETNPSGDSAGIARRRIISQYKPGRSKRDYIFEFTGQIEQHAMGWVFRIKDARNYYCLKLEKTGGDASGAVQLVKFAVVNGAEQPHRLVALREPIRAGVPVRIRLDIRGQNFSTQVNGKHVDVWIDNQLTTGTVGFSNESGERAVIRTVKVTY